MSHREEQTGRSKIDCSSSRGVRRTSADDKSCDRADQCRQRDGGSPLQDVSHQKNAIKELECKLDQERRQNKKAIDELLRERDALQYRYKMKELRLQEVMLQFKQFKDNQAPTYQRLRQCFLEPSVNLIFEKMKAEVDENKKAKEEAMSDLHAWSFTAESQTGKRLVARCKKLLQENEEFGKMVTSGNVAKLNTEIAMQKRLVDEMHANEKEYDALVLEMDEELDLLTCACKQLQNKLYETVRLSKDVPAHKADGKQSTRRLAASDASQHVHPRQAAGDLYKSNAIRQKENAAGPDHNGVMANKRSDASKSSSGAMSKAAARPTGPTAEQEAKQPLSPMRRATPTAGRQTVLNAHKDETALATSKAADATDVNASDGLRGSECIKSAAVKPAKQATSSQESSVDDRATRSKAHGVKPSVGKDASAQKQSDSGEKRRKPASNDSLAAQSNPPKNKRRARRLSSEEQERHASKIQNVGSSKENQHSLGELRQENAGDGGRRSPPSHSSPGSRNHRPADQARRPAGKSSKSSRPNWEMEHSLSPGHGRQRDGIRSSVNKTSSNANKRQGQNGSSGRKIDGRRSSPGYRYGEPRRRRHSPTRNYR